MSGTALGRIVAYAYKNVDYYTRVLDGCGISPGSVQTGRDLEKLPLLDKETVQREINTILSSEYKKYPNNSRLEIRRTSGSTGEYLKVCWDLADNAHSMLPIWRARKKWYSVTPRMKYCTFYTANYAGNKIMERQPQHLSSNGRILSFSKADLTPERLAECYAQIVDFNPDWMSLQPTIAALLAGLVKEKGCPLPSNLKYIELNGELLTEDCRREVEEAFHIRPVNMYGTTETNPIALEAPDQKLHVLEDNAVVEVLKEGVPVWDEEGDIYVTSLHNRAMPFLRYATGDRGILREEEQPKGGWNQILTITSGRASDYIRLKGGERISAYVFVGFIQYVNESMENAIRQFQVAQTALDRFEVTIALKPAYQGWNNAVQKAFLEHIDEERLQGLQWDFRFVDSIYPDKKTGKLRYFIPMAEKD